MPFSSPAFDEEVQRFMYEHPFSTMHDIGCGSGKYGMMAHNIYPEAKLYGIEPESSYLGRFNLFNIYKDVWVQKAIDLIDDPDRKFELVMMGDCIEHMRKSEGIDLINFLMYRCKHLIIIYPDHFEQNSWEGVKTEAHISSWQWADFEPFLREEDFHVKDQMQMAILRGFFQ